MDALPYSLPRPLGDDWQHYFGSSAFGALWRATRINRLQRSDLRTILGVVLRADDDAFARITSSAKLHAALTRAYPGEDFTENMRWDIEPWWPFGGRVPPDIPWRLRICLVCARHCYHTMLFQMPGVDHCPWHGVPLTNQCPRCERDLLGGFRDGRALGACSCGWDPVDFVAAIQGDAAAHTKKKMCIEDYLTRTLRSRQETWLIPPEQQDVHAWTALKGLVLERVKYGSTTQAPSNPHPAVMFDKVTLDHCLQYPAAQLSPKSGLESFKPDIVALPVSWYSQFGSIAHELSKALVKPLGERVTTDEELRSVLKRLPVHVCGRRMFLQTEVLHRTVLRTAGRLCAVLATPQTRRFTRSEAYVERIEQHPLGRRLVERTVQRVLARGYADGTRVALGRQVPQLYDEPTSRPVTRYPWVLLHLRNNRLPTAKIGWTRQPTLS